MANAGDYRFRISIFENQPKANDANQTRENFVHFVTRWARKPKGSSAGEQLRGNAQRDAHVRHIWRVRRDRKTRTITPSMRLVYDGVDHNIEAVVDVIDGSTFETEIVCIEVQ